jgi:hypothetical protein
LIGGTFTRLYPRMLCALRLKALDHRGRRGSAERAETKLRFEAVQTI